MNFNTGFKMRSLCYMCAPWGDVRQKTQPGSVTVVLSNTGSCFKILHSLFIYSTTVKRRGDISCQHNTEHSCFLKWPQEMSMQSSVMRLDQLLSPVLHSNSTHWPFLSLCFGLQRRQWSAVQMMQSSGQGSHRLLAEWKNPSGQASRHWLW